MQGLLLVVPQWAWTCLLSHLQEVQSLLMLWGSRRLPERSCLLTGEGLWPLGDEGEAAMGFLH